MDRTHKKTPLLHPRMPASSTSTEDPDSQFARRTRSNSPLYPEEPQRRWQQPNDATSMPPPSNLPPSPYGQKQGETQYFNGPKSSIPDKPLIDLVTNQWRSDPRYSDYHHKEFEEDEYGQFVMTDSKSPSRWSCPSRYPRKTIRYLVLYVMFLSACFYYWKAYLRPVMNDEDMLDASMYKASLPGKQFGTNAQPEFTNMVHIQYLDSEYVPGATHASRKRLIVVGDVHGCKTELVELMRKVSFNKKHDHLILAGDIVFKGPDSGSVIDYVRSLDASCVRGNHDDRTLLAYASMHAHPIQLSASQGAVKDNSNEEEIVNVEDPYAHGDIKHRQLARQLTKEQIHWLQKCPVVLNIGNIDKKDYVVVHAGLAPGIRLEKQDPFNVMNMRTIDLDTRIPSELRDFEPWDKVWNHFQSHLQSGIQRKTVIYGHDSHRGLNLNSYSKGIDSGCVSGGKLTALIINEKGKEQTVSVKCRNYRAKEK